MARRTRETTREREKKRINNKDIFKIGKREDR
jgi:hypothetical protein